jgi:hypothetical protein
VIGKQIPRTKGWPIAIIVIILICLLVDLSLALWRIQQVYFVSVPIFQFVAIAWGVLTGTITVAATLIRVGGAVLRALRDATAEPRPFSIDETIRTVIRLGGVVLRSPPRSFFVLAEHSPKVMRAPNVKSIQRLNI